MKKNLLLYFFVLCTISGWAQIPLKKGIEFYQGTFKELLNEARQKDKMIFIDVYTDWCGPCKYMDKFVFTEPMVAARYNPNFLSYRLNAEKGEGIALAKKYGINAYPTFLFLNNRGYLVHKVVGEKEKDPFAGIAEQALKHGADPNNLGNLEKKFKEGNRSAVFLKNYLNRLNEMGIDNSSVLDEYFKTIPSRQLQEDSTLLYLANQVTGTRTVALTHLQINYDQLSLASKEKVTPVLFEKLIRYGAGAALKEKRQEDYIKLISFGKQLYGLNENQNALLNRLDLMYSIQTQDYIALKKAGYLMAKTPYSIPNDTIRREDKRRYDEIILPFIKGEKDSTKISGFQEEKKLITNGYSREIGEKLYTAAQAFSQLPPSEAEAIADALAWAKRSRQLLPDNTVISALVRTLEDKTRKANGSN